MILLACLIAAFSSVSGTVYDAGSREPIPFDNISVEGTIYGTSTDSLGKFFIRIQPGNYTIKITHIGYKEKFVDIKLSADEELELSIFLEKEAIHVEEVEVLGKRISEPSFRVLEAEELKKIPFAELDFFRTIQALPGVGFVSDLIGWLYVRGGMPEENLYLMDGGEILCPHHYFGVVSAFNVNLLEDVRFSCGGFSPSYGDRLSAVLDVRTKDGSLVQRKTSVEADLLETGIETEFPLTSACSYIFSLRKNYFRWVAPLVGIEGGVILPDYQNFQNRLSFSFSENHKISLSSLLMQDEASISESMMGSENEYSWKNKSNTYVLNYKTTLAKQPMRTIIYHATLDRDASWLETAWGAKDKDKRIRKTGIKQVGEFRFWENYRIGWGISRSYIDYYTRDDYPLEFMGFNRYGKFIRLTAETFASQSGAYLLMNVPLTEKILITLGSRMDYISLTKHKILSPRLRLSYSLNPQTSFSLAWGYYHQFPAFEFLALAPWLSPAVANHYIIGVERGLGKDIKGRIELYEKKVTNLTFIDVENIRADNTGYGYARGIEIFLRKSFTDNFLGWLSCSFSKTRRTGLFDNEVADFDADQPFSLNLIGVYTFGKYAISTTYRHTSGRPYTPVAGCFWDGHEWKYVGGLRNSARYPPYDRLDIRVERGFRIFNTSGDFYFTVLNVFQHRNIQIYEYTETRRQPIYMLPRLAFLGVKFNF